MLKRQYRTERGISHSMHQKTKPRFQVNIGKSEASLSLQGSMQTDVDRYPQILTSRSPASRMRVQCRPSLEILIFA